MIITVTVTLTVINDVHYDKPGNFIWTTDGRTESRSFPFTGPNRATRINIDDVTDPLCILKEFITPEVIEMIVRSTNDYAQGVINHPRIQEHILKTKRSVFQLWMPVNSDEIWIYFCITFLMGIIQKRIMHLIGQPNL